MNDSAPRVRKGTASRQRGRDRVATILAAANDLFSNEGFAGLSLRRVADACGISLGNLTYYFSSKADLFESMIAHILREYADAGRSATEFGKSTPAAGLEGYLRFLFADCRKKDTQRFFYQFWAAASHDEFVSRARRRVYEEFQKNLCQICSRVNGKLSKGELEQRAVLIMALVEGLHVVLGNGERSEAFIDKLEAEYIKQALLIAG